MKKDSKKEITKLSKEEMKRIVGGKYTCLGEICLYNPSICCGGTFCQNGTCVF